MKYLVEKLKQGEEVQFRPRGNSMSNKIMSGQLCVVMPVSKLSQLNIGDIVLCKVHGKIYFHLITAIQENRFQISNNHGHINGWTSLSNIYGKYKSTTSP